MQPRPARGLRRIERDELHLTLHFLGDVAEADTPALRRALQTVRANSFSMRIRGVGRFPPSGRANVLWAGVNPNPDLSALHESIGATTSSAIAWQPEARSFTPHVTLARCKTAVPLPEIEQFLNQGPDVEIASLLVQKFALFSSEVRNNAPYYQIIAEFPLREPKPAP